MMVNDKLPSLEEPSPELLEEIKEQAAEAVAWRTPVKTAGSIETPVEVHEACTSEIIDESEEIEESEEDEEDEEVLDTASDTIPVDSVSQSHPDLILPPFKTVNMCTLCIWSKHNIKLYNWVASKALMGCSPRAVHRLLIEHMTNQYPHIKPPYIRSVFLHFKNHISQADQITLEIARKGYKEKGTEAIIKEELINELRQGNFDEYKELCALYVKFRETNDMIYEAAASLLGPPKGGVREYSQNKIQTYVTMVNTQKAILSEIAKMRQGDKLIEVVSKYLLETYTKDIVDRLSAEFSALSNIMQRHDVDPNIINTYNEITHSRLAKIILDGADRALTMTKKEFKLPIN